MYKADLQLLYFLKATSVVKIWKYFPLIWKTVNIWNPLNKRDLSLAIWTPLQPPVSPHDLVIEVTTCHGDLPEPTLVLANVRWQLGLYDTLSDKCLKFSSHNWKSSRMTASGIICSSPILSKTKNFTTHCSTILKLVPIVCQEEFNSLSSSPGKASKVILSPGTHQ